ncbi:hypothetical protein D7X94_07825 [Acutalibacter sp. 1XD8-33]|nr:hypothetical protein D7X94_07825 [Acutalibacter sp. 1XD8-33]
MFLVRRRHEIKRCFIVKRILTVLAAALLVSLLAVSASAATAENAEAIAEAREGQEEMRRDYLNAGWKDISSRLQAEAHAAEIDPDTWELAHRDLEAAAEEEKEAILAARNEIIYSYSWSIDEVTSYVLDPEKQEFGFVPSFSELFPEDWDVPCQPISEKDRKALEEQMAASMVAMSEEFVAQINDIFSF